MCIEKIKALFRKKELKVSFFNPERHFIRTGRGGLNMPKRQPCPQCHRRVKRDTKTNDGAYYRCTNCDLYFLIKLPEIQKVKPKTTMPFRKKQALSKIQVQERAKRKRNAKDRR